jgi:hypothetical protein
VSDAFRGFVLLLSVVLWSPCLMPVIDGGMTVAEGGVRYALALLLAWGGSAAVVALVKAYAPAVEEPAVEAPPVPVQAPPPGVEKAQAEVLVERRKTPRDDDAIAT